MQKKTTMLKYIHNLETQGKNENPFTILNNTSVDYLERVAYFSGIGLGSQLQSPK